MSTWIDDNLDDYEVAQDLYSGKTWDALDGEGGPLTSIFDGAFNGTPRSEMYRAQVVPDLFPHERPMRIENWSSLDREMYCGGVYTPDYGMA